MSSGRFSESAQKALNRAAEIAAELACPHITTGHLLLGMLDDDTDVPPSIRKAVNADEVRELLTSEYAENSTGTAEPTDKPEPSANCHKAVEIAVLDASHHKLLQASKWHLWKGLLSVSGCTAIRILRSLGVEMQVFYHEVTREVMRLNLPASVRTATDSPVPSFLRNRPQDKQPEQPAASEKQKFPFLEKYCRDLTDAAVQGKLDPVIGRETELQRIAQILIRRTKNNPVLVGEPGVGKSAVVEGLAQRIVNNTVPEMLSGKRVLSLDISSMVAGTKYRGEFESRMKTLLDELRKSGDVILFIDELHNIIGAGGADGAMDAANILKPALARGEL